MTKLSVIVEPVCPPNFGAAVIKSEGEWVAYDNVPRTHKRHLIYPDNIETLDNKDVHTSKSIQNI